MNRLQTIAQAANKIRSENYSQKLKFAGIARQAIQLSDREYTDKKSVDTIKPLMF